LIGDMRFIYDERRTPIPFGKNAKSFRREVAARLKRRASFGPMVDGSLVVVRRRCGNPR